MDLDPHPPSAIREEIPVGRIVYGFINGVTGRGMAVVEYLENGKLVLGSVDRREPLRPPARERVNGIPVVLVNGFKVAVDLGVFEEEEEEVETVTKRVSETTEGGGGKTLVEGIVKPYKPS